MRKWTRQPPANTPIDWSNSLAKGLIFAVNGADSTDLVNKFQPEISGDAKIRVPTNVGSCLQTINTNVSRIDYSANDELRYRSPNEVSLLVAYIGRHGTVFPNYSSLVRFGYSGSDRPNNYMLQTTSNSDNLQFAWGNTASTNCFKDFVVPIGAASDGRLHIAIVSCIFGTTDADDIRMFFDGRELFDTIGGGGDNNTAATDFSSGEPYRLRIGSRYASLQGSSHDQPLTLVWNRALSLNQAKQLSANPWQIFKPPKQFALADVPDDVRFLPVEKPWKKQPPAGTPIDWGNPLTKSMVACFVFNEESGNLRDLVKSRSITQGGTPDRITTPQGLAHAFGGTSDRYVVPNSSELNATGDFTVVVGFTNQEVGQNVEIVEKQLGNPMWQIYNAATGNNLEFYGRDSAGTLITLDSVTTLDVGKYVQAAGVKSVANDRVYLYINGYLEDDVEDTSTGDWSNTADMLIADGSAAGMFNGYIHYLYIFQDAKDAEQIARIHENPWQIFKPQIIHAPADVALPDLATFERDW